MSERYPKGVYRIVASRMKPGQTIYCRFNGRWSADEPECEVKELTPIVRNAIEMGWIELAKGTKGTKGTEGTEKYEVRSAKDEGGKGTEKYEGRSTKDEGVEAEAPADVAPKDEEERNAGARVVLVRTDAESGDVLQRMEAPAEAVAETADGFVVRIGASARVLDKKSGWSMAAGTAEDEENAV